MILDLLAIGAGIVIVLLSGDRLVTASARLARRRGVSPIVVGAIVIGFGSSLPELLVSLLALDQPNGLDLAVGNVIGSNIANLSIVLGVGAALSPIVGQSEVLRREGLLMLGALSLATLFLWDGRLGIPEGAVALVGLAGTGWLVVRSEDASRTTHSEPQVPTGEGRDLGIAVLTLIGLAVGARAMVIGAEGFAIRFGLAEGVVGMTILALGTSLPELGTVFAAIRRGQPELVLGNVLGSNLFNALGVLGAIGVLGPGRLAVGIRGDLAIMLCSALAAGAMATTGHRLRRREGALLATAYPLAVAIAL